MNLRFLRNCALSACLLASLVGCRSGGGLPLLNLLPSGNKNIVVGLASDPKPLFADDKIEPINPLERFEPWRKAAQTEIGRPVLLDFSFEIQLVPNLNLGIWQFACLTPAQYARIPERDRPAVLATSVDAKGRAGRSGLLVVAAGSPVQKPADLRGKVIGFGPERETRVHAGGLKLLESSGLKKTDLSLEVLPVPGSVKAFPNPRAVVQSVINASSEAGFIDEAFFESLPPTAADKSEPSQDKLRVIGKTEATPDWLVVAGPKADGPTRDRFKSYLLEMGKKQPDGLKKLEISGYAEPTPQLLAACQVQAR